MEAFHVVEPPLNKLVLVITYIIADINSHPVRNVSFVLILTYVEGGKKLVMLTIKHKLICPEDFPVAENVHLQL